MKHTLEELESVLRYDPETGLFHWRRVSRGRPLRLGLVAGSPSHGYISISYQKVPYRAHVLAWAIMTRQWPDMDIDHENGLKDDNRWTNLRLATAIQNAANTRIRKNNSSGHKNVNWNKHFKRWQVQIKGPDGKRHCRYRDSLDEAVRLATEIRIKLHGEFARHS